MTKLLSAIAAAALAVVSLPVKAADTSMETSWYGPYFHGRTTANGEVYNMYALTAAHKTLPFGTRLRVCLNGCVDVRINDRGPYVGKRDLDLSFRAAEIIGLTRPGVAYTSVTYL
tara:strand:- start:11732 stop:12076 length:345 start_codon:yes stop_codon:yes gene_type:complete